jgi:hypothetical protein
MSTETLDLKALFAPLQPLGEQSAKLEETRSKLLGDILELEKRRLALGVHAIFQTFPQLESFYIDGEFCSDDEGGTLLSLGYEYPAITYAGEEYDGELIEEDPAEEAIPEELESIRLAIGGLWERISSEIWEDLHSTELSFTRDGLDAGWRSVRWKDGELLPESKETV